MEVLSVARPCAGSTSSTNIDRKLKSLSTRQVTSRNSSSFLGLTFLPKELSFPTSSRGQGGRLERRVVPSALLNAHEYRKQQLEKVFLKEMGSDTFEDDDDERDLCPVECVREISKLSELEHVIQYSSRVGALVVVDFYRTSCGSCRYIEKGLQKLCKGAGNGEASVIFLKHNVMDEYDEQSEIAEKFRIKVVPLFHFYKKGELVDSFPTRDKSRVLAAICKHLDVDQTIEECSDLHGRK